MDPHPILADRPLRDWAWIWGRSTIGPVMLTLRFARGRDELAAFLAGLAPMPYVRVADDRYRVPAGEPTPRLREIRLFAGGLTLLRDYHHPPDELVAFDTGLLAALAGGALGELTWDVIDGDWAAYLATGDTAESLGEYLDPAADADRQAARWREVFAVRRVDAGAATTPAEVVGLLSSFLGASAPMADAEFDAWLAARPREAVPRRIEVTVSAALDAGHGVQWLFDRVLAAQPRVSWSVRRA
ncbi:hypothetical protein [Nannocystis pusilla]|uniref:hypothetical protein n=1 Tax=Nannocystis pusilla TaxID=889268 RepID=UPI003B80F993